MSKLDNLIKQYCPDGVEYNKIGDVCTVITGGEPPADSHKNQDNTHPYPVWGNGKDVYGYSASYEVEEDATVISSIGANTGSVYFREGHFTPIIRLKVVVPKDSTLNAKFLYYALSSQKIESKSSSVPNMNADEIKRLQIPVPPISIQDEIVRILDSFTKLTAELTAELTARRTQYEYYRDKLLTFDDETAIVKRIKDMLDQTCGGPEKVEYRLLSDVVGIRRGKRVTRQDLFENGEYPVFQNSLIPLGYYDEYNVESETPYIICAGAAGDIGYCSGKFWAADDCFFIEHPEKITRRYVYYFLLTKQEYLKSKVRKASVPRLAHAFIDKLEIPMPPFEVQQEIVFVLDKFNTLTTDISTGLPAEISLRQKQYEHYRDRLLNFNGGGYVMSEKLCFIRTVSLGDVTTIKTGKKPKEIKAFGDYEYINAGTSASGFADDSNCQSETITTPSRGQGGIGYIGYQSNYFWLGPLCYGIRSKAEGVRTKYLYYYLSSKKQLVSSLKKEGGTEMNPSSWTKNQFGGFSYEGKGRRP